MSSVKFDGAVLSHTAAPGQELDLSDGVWTHRGCIPSPETECDESELSISFSDVSRGTAVDRLEVTTTGYQPDACMAELTQSIGRAWNASDMEQVYDGAGDELRALLDCVVVAPSVDPFSATIEDMGAVCAAEMRACLDASSGAGHLVAGSVWYTARPQAPVARIPFGCAVPSTCEAAAVALNGGRDCCGCLDGDCPAECEAQPSECRDVLQCEGVCPTRAPSDGFRLLFRQTAGNYRPASEFVSLGGDPSDLRGDFSELNELEECRQPDGLLHLKLAWPTFDNATQEWKQASNPVIAGSGGVSGYERMRGFTMGAGVGNRTVTPDTCSSHAECAPLNYCDSQPGCWECDSINPEWCDSIFGQDDCCTEEFLAHCPVALYPDVRARCGEPAFFGGLEYNGDDALLDGTVGEDGWAFAVGSSRAYEGGLRGPGESAVDVVELWARCQPASPAAPQRKPRWLPVDGLDAGAGSLVVGNSFDLIPRPDGADTISLSFDPVRAFAVKIQVDETDQYFGGMELNSVALWTHEPPAPAPGSTGSFTSVRYDCSDRRGDECYASVVDGANFGHDANEVGDGWIAETDSFGAYLTRGGTGNFLRWQYNLGTDDFTVEIDLTLSSLSGSAATFELNGNSHFGFEGGCNCVFLEGPFFGGSLTELASSSTFGIQEGAKGMFRVERQGDQFQFFWDGNLVTSYSSSEAVTQLGLRPWRATMKVYSWVVSMSEPACSSHGERLNNRRESNAAGPLGAGDVDGPWSWQSEYLTGSGPPSNLTKTALFEHIVGPVAGAEGNSLWDICMPDAEGANTLRPAYGMYPTPHAEEAGGGSDAQPYLRVWAK